jgi:putative flippase GtrA
MIYSAAGPVTLVHAFFRPRVCRFALVGMIGVPINLILLWFFHGLLRLPIIPAWICAFEPSTLLNFYANQRFTYHEQTHLRGWDWPVRALKAQATSLTGLAINAGAFALLLALGLPYLPAGAIGIAAAFTLNFLIANRFVFTAARLQAEAAGRGQLELEGIA